MGPATTQSGTRLGFRNSLQPFIRVQRQVDSRKKGVAIGPEFLEITMDCLIWYLW